MPDVKYSLLSDDILEVRDTGGDVRRVTLPEVFALLADDAVASFEALQAHQKQAWYLFVTQVGAMAVARETDGELPATADGWHDALLGLADDEEAVWSMVVDDVSKPAFMQPPVPEGSLEEAGFSNDVQTPDDLDMLILTKSHDLKKRRIRRPAVDHWLYALVTLQTLEGYSGRANYGIARMNGGLGNRPLVGLAPDLSWGTRFLHDVDALLEARQGLIQERYTGNSLCLLWTVPWTGEKGTGIDISTCDPFFVEICRRIRFRERSDGSLQCWRNTTKCQRIANAKDYSGVTGDPWTPVDVSDGKALTVSGQGFDYRLIQEIWLGGDDDTYEQPTALQFHDDDPEGGVLVATTLVRGQGKTDGLHRRTIPVPKKTARLLGGEPSDRKRLGERAERRVDRASEVQKKVLAPALISLLEAGQDRGVEYGDVTHWLDHFDSEVDNRFFDELWRSIEEEMSGPEAERAWQGVLFELAEAELERAIETCPLPDIMRYRAISEATSRFWASARDVLGAYIETTFDSEDDETDTTEASNEPRV